MTWMTVVAFVFGIWMGVLAMCLFFVAREEE